MRYRSPVSLTIAVSATVVLAAGCYGNSVDVSGSAGVVVRDSAGVTIVENPVSEPEGVQQWSVDSTPLIVIGEVSGDSAYEFSGIRFLRLLPANRIAVVDGPGESFAFIRIFDSTGRHIATHGRPGNGPGEFRWIRHLAPIGPDTLMAYDWVNARISFLSVQEGFVNSIPLRGDVFEEITRLKVSLEQVTPLGGSVYAVFGTVASEPGGVQHDAWILVNTEERSVTELARLARVTRTELQLSNARTIVTNPEHEYRLRVVDPARQRFCMARNVVAQLDCVEAGGKRLSIRWQFDTIPFGAEDRREAVEGIRDSYTRMNRTNSDIEKRLAMSEYPERFNAILELELDAEGNFWIMERHLDAAGERAMRYRILSPEGRVLAFAPLLPALRYRGLSSRFIGADRVLRTLSDSLDVPHVGVFRLRKAGG